MSGLVIDSVGGWCPCQAEGTFHGHPFYFRARHGMWTLDVAEPGGDPVTPRGVMRYRAEGPDPDGGYMPEEAAKALLCEHFTLFERKNPHLTPQSLHSTLSADHPA